MIAITGEIVTVLDVRISSSGIQLTTDAGIVLRACDWEHVQRKIDGADMDLSELVALLKGLAGLTGQVAERIREAAE